MTAAASSPGDDLSSLYAFNSWANARVLETLRAVPEADYVSELGGGWPSLRATFVHLAGATDAWAERFAGRDATRLATIEELPSLEDAARVLLAAEEKHRRLQPALTRERLAGPFTWKNLKGEAKTAPFWAVVRHVVNHQTYHRGQIAAMVRRLGHTPKPTDMVVWGIEILVGA
ncbi:MAG: DinB family protein [Acidobacteriota bacterium]|nr:DinB family protein [Acidobacteriota bacterium]